MAFEDDIEGTCKPHKYADLYIAGYIAGTELNEGFVNAAKNSIETEQMSWLSNGDPVNAAAMVDDFNLGLRCADPTDIKIDRVNGMKVLKEVDDSAEIMATFALNNLDKFSSKPLYDHSLEDTESPEQAIHRLTEEFAKRSEGIQEQLKLHPQLWEDFCKDFNRRRQENNYLPNFEAYIDDSDKQAKIRHLVLKIKRGEF